MGGSNSLAAHTLAVAQEEDQRVAQLPISTRDSPPPGTRVIADYGVVMAAGGTGWKESSSDVKTVLQMIAMASKAGRNKALIELHEVAKKRGANAILGMHFDVQTRHHLVVVTAYGTAVRLDKDWPHPDTQLKTSSGESDKKTA